LGIGLALVRELVDMHHGRIKAESAGPGRGSTFRIALPAVLVSPVDSIVPDESQQPLLTIAKGSLRGTRVLIVDDQADARQWVARMLADTAAEVVEAASADEALAEIQAAPPRILISDIAMPERDGYDLIRQVRTLPGGAEILAIALTAYARPEEQAKALAAGFQVHVAKPVDGSRLLAAMAQLLHLADTRVRGESDGAVDGAPRRARPGASGDSHRDSHWPDAEQARAR
jgi:CheY-like chemotaxis protein